MQLITLLHRQAYHRQTDSAFLPLRLTTTNLTPLERYLGATALHSPSTPRVGDRSSDSVSETWRVMTLPEGESFSPPARPSTQAGSKSSPRAVWRQLPVVAKVSLTLSELRSPTRGVYGECNAVAPR